MSRRGGLRRWAPLVVALGGAFWLGVQGERARQGGTGPAATSLASQGEPGSRAAAPAETGYGKTAW